MITAMNPKGPRRSLPRNGSKRRIHHRHSAQSVAVSLASRLIVKNAVRAGALQPNLHWPLEYVDSMAGLLPRFRSSARIEPIRLEHCSAEWVRARGTSSTRAILYLHGDAFLTCGLNTHRSVVCRLSKAADAGVLTVGYRKLPSHQIADAIQDGMSGLRWLRQARLRRRANRRGRRLRRRLPRVHDHARCHPDPPCDAGGNCCRFAFHRPGSGPKTQASKRAQVLDVHSRGIVDVRSISRRSAAPGGPGEILSPRRLTGGRRSVGAAPVTIHASSDELLLPDAELMAKRLEATGIRCDLHLWDGQIHDFPLAADILPEGRRAIRYIGDFVKEVTGGVAGLPSAPLTAAG